MNKVERKLSEITDDLEANVVRINGRRDLIQAVDLVYHSVLTFNFAGERVRKGVVELLIIGDTRTGKSSSVQKMGSHYGYGDFITAGSVSQAGLLGGVDEANRRRFLKAGRLPLAHRRLVVIDEANEMPEELIAKLSGVRSEGYYDVVKISGGRLACLTRMIWIANTRTSKNLAAYPYGVEAIPEVIGKPEDVARFDLAMCISGKDVDVEALSVPSRNRPKVTQRYTHRACHRLITWIWSRKATQIIIPDRTEDAVLVLAKAISGRYAEDIPLVLKTEARIQIARLAVAVAGRVASTDETGELILVEPDHAEAATNILQRCLDAPSCGFDVYSSRRAGKTDLSKEVRDLLIPALGLEGIQALLGFQTIQKGDFGSIFASSEHGARAYQIAMLGGGLVRAGRGMRFSSQLLDVMRKSVEGSWVGSSPNPELLKPSDGLGFTE